MKHALFGWLVKGRCDITILDSITMLGEIAVIVGFYMLLSLLFSKPKKVNK